MTPFDDIERSLSEEDAEVRRRAVAELASFRGEPPTGLLLRALGDEDWRVRKEAASVAVSLGPSRGILDALIAALEQGDNVGLRNAAVDAIAGYGVHAVGALAAALGRLDADGRKLVVDSLARSARPEGLPLLRSLVHDDDANVRGAAIEAISILGGSRAEEAIAILDACLDTPDRYQRLAALEGLNRLIAVLPWERIAPLLDDPILSPAALRAAGRSAQEAAVPVLVRELERAGGRSWYDALAALVELGRSVPSVRARIEVEMKSVSPLLRHRIIERVRDEAETDDRRRTALAAIGWLSGAEGATVAVEALVDDALAAEAEAALAELGSTATPALLAGARGASPEQRAACVGLLGPMAPIDDEAARAIEAALEDEAPEVVAAALDALPNMHAATPIDMAADWLVRASSALVHQAAQRALGLLARRHPAAARALGRRCPPSSRKAEIAATIIEVGASPMHDDLTEDIGYLVAALSGEHASVRRAAVSALGAVGGELGLEPIAFALTDEDPEVRQVAVRALGRLRARDGAPLGLERLLSLLGDKADPGLVAAAARALGELCHPASWSALVSLCSAEPRIAVAAVTAVAATADPRRVDALIGALGHPDPEVVKASLRALASISDPRVIEELATCVDHSTWDVRRLVAELLGRLGGDQALHSLRGRLDVESEPRVADALTRALAEAETSGGRRLTAPPPSLGKRPM